MEKFRHVILYNRKGLAWLAAILSCLLIVYWFYITNTHTMVATKSIKGKLYNASTGQPVAGAMIMITEGTYEHQDIASQSDEAGTFFLPEVKIPGMYTLLIRHPEYSKTVTVNITSDSILNIPL